MPTSPDGPDQQRGERTNTVVFGDVLCFHVDEAVREKPGDYKIDPGKLKAIGRMGGPTYTRTRDRFDLVRPK